MKRSMWMLPVALLLVAGTQVYSTEPPSGPEARKNIPPKPGVQIAEWTSQLDSDEFNVREQAVEVLTKAGLKALPAVLTATESKQPEVRSRAFAILFAMSKSDDRATANAALAAVKEILKSPDRHRVAQANKILKKFHEWEIQGKWMVVEIYAEGKKRDDVKSIGFWWAFSGTTLSQGSHTAEIQFIFDEQIVELRPDQKPRELDIIANDKKGRAVVSKGIYELSGDTLKICIVVPGRNRPASMDTAADDDDKRTLLIFKRVKGEKGKDKK